jgi:6,7-dimethyl-8-ribityllumazine synthase
MEIKKTNLSDYDPSRIPDGSPYRIAIVAAEWNGEITNAMLEGAYNTLLKHGTKEENVTVMRVPGTFELTSASDILLSKRSELDAVICIGCVIQGETRHFDFICESVANGLAAVAVKHGKPVIFSVLTTNNMEQAHDRAGGKHGNKGVEGAVTALKMCEFANA